MASLEVFLANMRDWSRHCERIACSSDPDDYIKCPEFERLCEMGPRVLPFLLAMYRTNADWLPMPGTPELLHRLSDGAFRAPQEVAGQMMPLREYCGAWLERNANEP